MTAGLVRISTFFADHAAGSQRQHIGEMLFKSLGNLVGHFLMIPAGIQAAFHIEGIRHIGDSGEQKSVLIMLALLDAFLDGTHHGRTGPGVAVALAVSLADGAHMGGEDQLLPLQKAVLTDRII